MANVKITQLPAASTVTANVDVLPMVHSGVTQKVTPDQIVNQVLKSPGAIGNTAPFTGAFTSLSCNTITSNGSATLNGTSIPANKTLVDEDSVQTLSSKYYLNPRIWDWDQNNYYRISPLGPGLATDVYCYLPVLPGNDYFSFRNFTETLTNKTISGSSNTLENISNASLTNSSITINGSSVSLGGSVTVSATAANALTIGTGLSGGSYNGSSAVTIAIDSSVATLSGVQTLTNKTISGSANTLSNIGNAALANSSITINSTPVSLGGSISIAEMTYPGSGIAVSTGSAWGSSLTAPSGAIVGTSDAQTLTNKTISGGSLNNCPIGDVTANSAAVTTLAISGAVSLSGSAGTSGQVLTSAGAGSAPTWTSVTGTGTVTSVSGTGTVSGITLSGTVTTSGSLTLGGTLDLSSYNAAGAFTTLSASSTVSGTGFSTYLASPPAIGGTAPAAGAFTTLSSTGNTTLGDASADTLTINAGTTTFAQGTANGVLYLNGSKVATSGSALTFDGTNVFRVTNGSSGFYKAYSGEFIVGEDATGMYFGTGSGVAPAVPMYFGSIGTTFQRWQAGGSEQMRLTSKGLLVGYTSDSGLSGTGNAIFSGNVGIGTSSPGSKLYVAGSATLAQTPGNSFAFGTGSFTLNGIAVPDYGIAYTESGGYNTNLFAWNNLRFFTQRLERLCIDFSGNLGLGVTPSAWANTKAFDIANYGAISTDTLNDGNVSVSWNAYATAYTAWTYKNTSAASRYAQFSGAHAWYTAPSGTAGNPITFTKAMTLDASGSLLVGKTTADDTSQVGAITYGALGVTVNTVDDATGSIITYKVYNKNATNNGYRFYVSSNGGISNYSANNVNLASDRRLKNTIEPVKSYWDIFKAIDWVTWLYNDQIGDRKNIGVIAQDLQLLAPELVCESGKEAAEGETPYLGLYDQDFKMAAMSVITQLVNKMDELHAEIESLKAKVN